MRMTGAMSKVRKDGLIVQGHLGSTLDPITSQASESEAHLSSLQGEHNNTTYRSTVKIRLHDTDNFNTN